MARFAFLEANVLNVLFCARIDHAVLLWSSCRPRAVQALLVAERVLTESCSCRAADGPVLTRPHNSVARLCYLHLQLVTSSSL